MNSKEEIFKKHYEKKSGKEADEVVMHYMGYCLDAMDEYTISLRKELEDAKAKIAELEKEVQIKQTAIDALLDHEF